MKRGYENLKYEPNRRRMHLNETQAWPVVKAALLLAGLAAAVAALILFALPAVKRAMRLAAPDAGATAGQTAPAHGAKLGGADPLGAVQPETVLLHAPESVRALADPFISGTAILFAAGAEHERLDAILRVDPATGACESLPVEKAFDTLRNPCEDAAYLAYADVRSSGGGAIRLLDKADGRTRELCTVEAGVPRLQLAAPYLLVWEHTADAKTRLSLWDLTKGASAALALFDDSPFGASMPWLTQTYALYADASARADGTGEICTVSLEDGGVACYDPQTFVHDPKAVGGVVAWLAGSHGEDSDLYIRVDGGAPMRIARGVVDFAVMDDYAVYSRDETVFACAFSDYRTYVLSQTGTNAQLAAASGRMALWRDVTDPTAPLWKYVWIG